MSARLEMTDTIAACATPPGEGGIAIVRVSGPDAERVMRRFFSAKPPKIESHRLYYGHIVNAGEREEAMCALMRAPKSYTCQDVCEFQIHGGNAAVSRLLRAIYSYGVRPAAPGEFTRRAFLNGRIDLSQAEAVMDVLRASGDAALRAGLREMDGGVARYVAKAQDELTGLLAQIEAALDFPEEIEQTDIEDDMRRDIISLKSRLLKACAPEEADMLRRGISVVLAGRPNVGKSSLMNALLGSERAIVTCRAGTTRDVLTEELELNGYRVRLSDTAGQRETGDEIERMGVERARTATAAADIVLLVLDTGEPLSAEDAALLAAADARFIIVLNKRDLAPAWDSEELAKRFEGRVCEVSARDMSGVDRLRQLMSARAAGCANPEALFLRERHIACAQQAAKLLKMAAETLAKGAPIELAALDLRGAREALGEITGQTADADVIDRIFSDFCVGK